MSIQTHRVLPKQAKAVKADLKMLDKRASSTNVLDLGDTGRAVEALQRQLKGTGLYKGKISGTFDDATQLALQAFQKAKKLKVTGALDRATLKALKSTNLFVKDGFKTNARIGQNGSDVRAAEAKLAKLGFLKQSEVDGVFDKDTQKAIQRYARADHQVKDGIKTIGQNVYKEISKAAASYDHAPRRRREVTSAKGIKKHQALDTAVAKAAKKQAKLGGIGLGAKGRSVNWLQKHLEAAGYELGAQDGRFGTRTEAAVRAFQQHAKLPVTGRVDERTWSKLKNSFFAAKSATSPAQREGEISGSVKRTEKLLKKLGYKVGKVDGYFSANTEKAVKAFQKKYGKKYHLKRTGVVGSGTLHAIEKVVKEKEGGSLAKVLKLARSQLGVRETPMGSNRQKYSTFFGRPPEPWCADFVSWCYTKAGKKLNIPYTPTLLSYIKKNHTFTKTKPKPGYIVVFDWHPGSGVPAEHTGIVEKVYRKNGQTWVQTIEGNNGNMVKRRNFPVNWSMVAGYGTVK
ncbi:MAG: peptidoglycan-binding protein [Myxococcaceae bacterium]|nr:peptidoglycan-binding protein [Myxococcaceae bacterium]